MGVCFFEWFSPASLLTLPQGWALVPSRGASSGSAGFVPVLGSSSRSFWSELGCAEPVAGDGAAAAASPASPRGMHRGCAGVPACRMGWERWEQWRCSSRENTLLEHHALFGQHQLLFLLTSPQAKAVTALTLLASVEMLKMLIGFKTTIISHRNPLK